MTSNPQTHSGFANCLTDILYRKRICFGIKCCIQLLRTFGFPQFRTIPGSFPDFHDHDTYEDYSPVLFFLFFRRKTKCPSILFPHYQIRVLRLWQKCHKRDAVLLLHLIRWNVILIYIITDNVNLDHLTKVVSAAFSVRLQFPF